MQEERASPPSAGSVVVQHLEGTTLLRLIGDFDADTTGAAMATFLELSSSPPDKLLIDGTGVTFLDSTAIGALVMVAVAVREHGGVVSMDPSPRARRALVLCGLDHLLALSAETIGQDLLQRRLGQFRS